jgi:hypothetical protein
MLTVASAASTPVSAAAPDGSAAAGGVGRDDLLTNRGFTSQYETLYDRLGATPSPYG